ncbi:hypothetical protein A3C95_01385 [Candidatus Kaiserbacteria bacterium RIFCSPHIGHO2_02_FULL_56_30]|uniref:DUF998 domain-containing protein n=1 Tax=Candidatus Kaiserbacteria bacterium RIFCSPHIGHO2_02_FULL_56_30 TaxID=1798499 RepID=A0A1F6E3J6_9BACT|nr:MAG: hypothetical protein A3C95_01385 [Candidatus Kaiserbacteria bacterium RIFCSPHIGHO2_02_FULL_56_30]
MNIKKQTLIGLGLSLIGFGIGYGLTNSTLFSFCLHDEYNCRSLLNSIGDPLYYGTGALAIVFVILYFVPRAWGAWRRFAIWFVPLAALLFAFYPEPGGGDLFSPYPEQVFQWVSALYLLVSVIIITFASLRSRFQ